MNEETALDTAHEPLVSGSPAVGFGTVWHRRNSPKVHQFTYPVNQLWLDPDDPEALCDRHPLWSASDRRPIRFRREDYFDGGKDHIGTALQKMVADVVGQRPDGPIRMLTQPRTWGWMFNPITVYFLWNGDGASDPVGAVLEVTNTPWKERFLYPLGLEASGQKLVARFSKQLHVSPFLDEDYDYHLSVHQQPSSAASHGPSQIRRLLLDIDVYRAETPAKTTPSEPVVQTSLNIGLHQPDRQTMRTALYKNLAPTHRVSLGIHWQAAQLAKKRIPFISHPGKRS